MVRVLLGVFIGSVLVSAMALAQELPATGASAAAGGGENLIRRGAGDSTASTSGGRSLAGDALRVAGSLAAVLGLIGLMYWGTRRILPRAAGGRRGSGVTVLATTHISPKQKILLIQVGRRVLAVGDGGGQLNTLCEFEDPDEVAALIGQIQGVAGEPDGSSFKTIFGAARGRANNPQPAYEPPGDEVEAARDQLDGLMQQVRGMTRQIDEA